MVSTEKRPPTPVSCSSIGTLKRLEQIAQAVLAAGLAGLGQAEEQVGDLALAGPRAFSASSTAMVCISVSPVPPDFEIATKRVVASGSLPSSVVEGVADRDCR